MGAAFAPRWDRTLDERRIFGRGHSVVRVTAQTWTAEATGAAAVDVVELFVVADGVVTEICVFPQDTHALLATLPSCPRGPRPRGPRPRNGPSRPAPSRPRPRRPGCGRRG
jgi:hypothetical protein